MNDTTAEQPSFEQSLNELEQLVRDLEDGQLGLEEALACYERGVALLQSCHQKLQQVEQRIALLTRVEDGQPVLQPFRHEATARFAPSLPQSRRAE